MCFTAFETVENQFWVLIPYFKSSLSAILLLLP